MALESQKQDSEAPQADGQDMTVVGVALQT